MTGPAARQLRALSEPESLRLLASVSVGRVVFSERAMPAVRPVNHLVDDASVIIRTHLGAALLEAARTGVVVAYEADQIDPDVHLGWSVVVVGTARIVDDQDEIRRYAATLRPWIARQLDHVIRIELEQITGYELAAISTGHEAVERIDVRHTSD